MVCERAFSPVHRDGSHRVYRREHGRDGEEVLESAVAQAEVPVIVKCVHKVKESVEGRHGDVREGEVNDEVVRYSPHASVSENNPDHRDVPSDGHQDDEGVGYSPQSHLREEEEEEEERRGRWRGEERETP